MSASAANVTLPHTADPQPAATYVEWARTVRLRSAGDDTVEVDVVFRTITETEDGFVRDPMSAVVVTMRLAAPDVGVIGVPVPIPVPTLASVVPE